MGVVGFSWKEVVLGGMKRAHGISTAHGLLYLIRFLEEGYRDLYRDEKKNKVLRLRLFCCSEMCVD